jgi:hypothetical protein
MEQKVALFEEYKTLTNRSWFVIDLEKTSVKTLQVLVEKAKIKLGLPGAPAAPLAAGAPAAGGGGGAAAEFVRLLRDFGKQVPAPSAAAPPAHAARRIGFAPEAFVQTYNPENVPHFNQETGQGGAANAGIQVAIRGNGGGKVNPLSQNQIKKLANLEPENLPLSKRRIEEYRLIAAATRKFLQGRDFLSGRPHDNPFILTKDAIYSEAYAETMTYLEEEVPKSIAAGNIVLEENETVQSIVGYLLADVLRMAEATIKEREKERNASQNVLFGGLSKLSRGQRKLKFNELFTQKFGHGPTNHVVNGIINQHNVHAGAGGAGEKRKTRKNKH